MKSEQIKELTNRAAEQLVATLQAGRSQALTAYLKAIGRFHRYAALTQRSADRFAEAECQLCCCVQANVLFALEPPQMQQGHICIGP